MWPPVDRTLQPYARGSGVIIFRTHKGEMVNYIKAEIIFSIKTTEETIASLLYEEQYYALSAASDSLSLFQKRELEQQKKNKNLYWTRWILCLLLNKSDSKLRCDIHHLIFNYTRKKAWKKNLDQLKFI